MCHMNMIGCNERSKRCSHQPASQPRRHVVVVHFGLSVPSPPPSVISFGLDELDAFFAWIGSEIVDERLLVTYEYSTAAPRVLCSLCLSMLLMVLACLSGRKRPCRTPFMKQDEKEGRYLLG